VLAQNGIEVCLHIRAFALVLRGFGIDGMVSGNDNPVFLGGAQYGVHPGKLLPVVLLAGIGIGIAFIAVFVNHRGGVYPKDADSSAFILECLGIITGRHCPAAADVTVVEHSLRIAAVFVVAQQGEPVYHQLRMAVDKFVVGHPKRVVHTAYTFKMVYIAGGKYEFGVCAVLCHLSHQFGNGFLVVVAVAAEVVGYVEVELLVEDGVIGNLGNSRVAE